MAAGDAAEVADVLGEDGLRAGVAQEGTAGVRQAGHEVDIDEDEARGVAAPDVASLQARTA